MDTLASRGQNKETKKAPTKNNNLPNANLLQGGNADAFKKIMNPASIVIFIVAFMLVRRLIK